SFSQLVQEAVQSTYTRRAPRPSHRLSLMARSPIFPPAREGTMNPASRPGAENRTGFRARVDPTKTQAGIRTAFEAVAGRLARISGGTTKDPSPGDRKSV